MPPLFQFLAILAFKIFISEQVSHIFEFISEFLKILFLQKCNISLSAVATAEDAMWTYDFLDQILIVHKHQCLQNSFTCTCLGDARRSLMSIAIIHVYLSIPAAFFLALW